MDAGVSTTSTEPPRWCPRWSRPAPSPRTTPSCARSASVGLLLVAAPPPGGPAPAEVMARARGENFPVASRLLPRRCRSHLLALYGFARLVDELGDSAQGDRLAALDWIERDLERAYAGRAEHPLMIALQRTLRECALPPEPFARLIEAHRSDQLVARYRSWAPLRGY